MKDPVLRRSFPAHWLSAGGDVYPHLYSGLLHGDNYGYFLETAPQTVLAVDVPDGQVMGRLLAERGWHLAALFLTHTHHDHIRGLPELLAETGCDFYFPAGSSGLPPGIPLAADASVTVAGQRVQVIETSGHSPMDFSYWFPELDLCFCGDTLFAWGCGRMFAGPPEKFWASLCRLRALPPETRLCCGHDYAADNLRFLKQIFPGGSLPQPARGEMPLVLADQLRQNPFLRADDPAVAAALRLSDADPVTVFSTLRELRNQL